MMRQFGKPVYKNATGNLSTRTPRGHCGFVVWGLVAKKITDTVSTSSKIMGIPSMDKSPEHQHMPCFFPNKTAGSDKKRNRKEVNQIILVVGGRTQWMDLPICIHTFQSKQHTSDDIQKDPDVGLCNFHASTITGLQTGRNYSEQWLCVSTASCQCPWLPRFLSGNASA